LLLGLIPAFIASRKGHSFIGWYIFGELFFILALPISLLLEDKKRECPFCCTRINKEAKICLACGKTLTKGGRKK
jgi:hypothetical protein